MRPLSAAVVRLAPLSALVVAALATPAHAQMTVSGAGDPLVGVGTRCVIVPSPPERFTHEPFASISKILYLERCKDGCTVNGAGVNDARSMTSAIPPPGQHAFAAFQNHLGESGEAADEQWNQFVSCVREVYSYYDIQVTDQKPAAGLSYHLNLVSGTPTQINLDASTLGISPFSCNALDNVISFTFSQVHNRTSAEAYVKDLCWTATHEAGHAFSLEHAFEFTDGVSACNDPMSYPTGACNPQRYFRQDQVKCGGFSLEPCSCGATQSSHLKLLGVFGPGTSTVAPPVVTITAPAAGEQLGVAVSANAGSKRGVHSLELLVNGHRWATAKGAPFGSNGQPNPSPYSLRPPDSLPGGVLDLSIRACDDIGVCTDSPTVTAMKGAPCTSADTCANGQRCDQGRCLWDPPVGEIGDECAFDQYCIEGLCRGTAERQICTQPCIPGVADSCPLEGGFSCIQTAPGQGICFNEPDGGGCCQTAGSGSPPWAAFAFGVGGLLLLGRRRRRARRA